MTRYFFALWPDDATRQQLETVSERLPDGCGRRVSTQNLHITLIFLGNVADQVMERIIREMDIVNSSVTELTLDQYGWWKKPRVIWLGTTQVPQTLVELAVQLKNIAGNNALRIESRPFTPHLTLVRKARRPLSGFSFTPIHWEIRDFCLVESITYPSGAVYRVIQNWPLTST